LRILRYFRFQARFGSQPADPEAETACAELASTLKGLSRERIGWELQNLLALDDPAPTVARMADLGVLAVILPEADPAPLAKLTAEERRQGVTPDPIRRLAALLPPDPARAEQVASRLRLSVAQRKRLASAAERETGDARALAYRLGPEAALDRLLLAGEDISPLAGWKVPMFPLRGGQVVARGVDRGPEVARILQAVETRWVAEGFPDEQRVAALLDEALRRPSAPA
jgi:poly(A) polymerase